MPIYARFLPMAPAPHRIALLCLEPVVAFDLSTPAEAFSLAWNEDGPLYETTDMRRPRRPRGDDHRLCDRSGGGPQRRGESGHGPRSRLPRSRAAARTGCSMRCAPPQPAARGWRRSAPARSPSPTLGLLDGRRATTHWFAAPELARRFPEIEVDPDALYVEDGRVVTSAGLSAGIDLCLHLIRSDHGERIGSQVARVMVAAPHRDGGQAQFIQRPLPPVLAGDSLEPVRRWALDHLAEPLDVATLAASRRREPAHVRPPLRRRDRHHAAQVAARPARPRGPPPARAHRPPGRARRLEGGVRLSAVAARALPPRHGDNADGVPADVRDGAPLGARPRARQVAALTADFVALAEEQRPDKSSDQAKKREGNDEAGHEQATVALVLALSSGGNGDRKDGDRGSDERCGSGE